MVYRFAYLALDRIFYIGELNKRHYLKHGVPDSKLRLYCIRYGNVAVILGGGGEKPKEMRAWQESDKLTEEASRMIEVSKAIMARLKSGEIEWSRDGMGLEGDLNFEEDEGY